MRPSERKPFERSPCAGHFSFCCIGNGDDDFADNGGSSGEPAGRQRLLGRQRARASERSAGWQLLFDGTSTAGWHGYNKQDTKAWTIEDCSLKTTGTQGNYGSDKRADLVTDTEFTNFELTLDWKASTGGNSGVIYGVIEDPKYDAPWKTGPEYQLLDDIGFKEKVQPAQKAGANYAMHPPDDANKVLKPVGEWNTTRIVERPPCRALAQRKEDSRVRTDAGLERASRRRQVEGCARLREGKERPDRCRITAASSGSVTSKSVQSQVDLSVDFSKCGRTLSKCGADL